MAAPKGNKFWEKRTKHGRDKLFSTPEILWGECVKYFQWVEDNPLWEAKLTTYQGDSKVETIPKMRAMTLEGLYIHLGINAQTWSDYRKRDDFVEIITQVESVIRDQKFSGAAADLLNPNIIARDLGLSDKKELSGPGGSPIQTITRTIVDPAK